MSKNKNTRPSSLAQHFDAPEEFTGHFGWLCGYSADAAFLNDAAERFTGHTQAQRAHLGRIALALMLDPGNPQISLVDAPGVAHLPMREVANKPFSLLHAKVALLGYRHEVQPDRWQIRLLVSTGNWTRQTLEESLDLIWRIDVDNQKLDDDKTARQNCADIGKAWDLLNWLQQTLFDTGLLQRSECDATVQRLNDWIGLCVKQAGGSPRFIHNKEQSLLDQIPPKIQLLQNVRRNYLAMGSGFYESGSGTCQAPEVPVQIVETLRQKGLLTQQSTLIDLYVNPEGCQSIATSWQTLRDEYQITVRPAAVPDAVFGAHRRRSLHAKFLFSANKRAGSGQPSSAWVYLGSGNLTHPGFAQKMGRSSGNLEAGVVFEPGPLLWSPEKGSSLPLVCDLLPIQWDHAIEHLDPIKAGDDFEERPECFVAPPISWLLWHEVDGVCELRMDAFSDEPSPSIRQPFEVLTTRGEVCPRSGNAFHWPDVTQPREVVVRWESSGQTLEARVPVVDRHGRIAATALPQLNLEEAYWQLADFPMPPDDDASDSDDGQDSVALIATSLPAANARTLDSSYPVRQMMELIEHIAAKQTALHEPDWPLWCNRLEQTLEQAADSQPVHYFREQLKLNPLSPLRKPVFRPDFAEDEKSTLGKRYEETLARIECRWNVKDLKPLGE